MRYENRKNFFRHLFKRALYDFEQSLNWKLIHINMAYAIHDRADQMKADNVHVRFEIMANLGLFFSNLRSLILKLRDPASS